MKKIFAVVALMAMLGSLMGCSIVDGIKQELKQEILQELSQETEPSAAATAVPVSDLTRGEVLNNFEKLITESELADFYTVTQLPATEFSEEGDIHQAIIVEDSIIGYSYHFSVRSNSNGYVYRVFLTHENSGYDGAFELFCLHAVDALKIEGIDKLELYGYLSELSEKSLYSMVGSGWELSATDTDKYLTFSAEYIGE